MSCSQRYTEDVLAFVTAKLLPSNLVRLLLTTTTSSLDHLFDPLPAPFLASCVLLLAFSVRPSFRWTASTRNSHGADMPPVTGLPARSRMAAPDLIVSDDLRALTAPLSSSFPLHLYQDELQPVRDSARKPLRPRGHAPACGGVLRRRPRLRLRPRAFLAA